VEFAPNTDVEPVPLTLNPLDNISIPLV
jgi:hypothetical protein